MKQNIKAFIVPLIIILLIIFVILIIFGSKYMSYNAKIREIKQFNYQYEEYNKSSLNGLDIATIINKAVSNNETSGVSRDDKDYYILDDERSIEIYVVMETEGEAYRMERFNKAGMDEFIRLFGSVEFKCNDITYHTNGKIASMTFEALEY